MDDAQRLTSHEEARPVLRKELAATLRSLREMGNRSLIEVATRLDDALRRHPKSSRLANTEVAKRYLRRGIDILEENVDGTVDLTRWDLALLAEAYDVHRLLLDPLLSRTCEDVCLVERFDSFCSANDPELHSYGRGAQYAVPARKLIGTERVSPVHLTIRPQGCSDTHWHAGHEWLFVLRGEVNVLLRSAGLRVHLHEHDYLHFDSDQEHCAFNSADSTAEVFVLRMGPRAVRAASSGGYRAESLQAVGESPGDREVFDRLSLGRLLKLACSDRFRGKGDRLTLGELERRGSRVGFNRTKFHRLHHGKSPLKESELIPMAAIYDVQPVLLYDWLSPVVPGAVAVRRRGDPELGPSDQGDLRSVPAEYLSVPSVSYQVPCRRLAGSDMSIAFLGVPPGEETSPTRHPGHEVLLPLEGHAEIRFGDTAASVDASKGLFVHFSSHRPHQFVNSGIAPFEALVVRVYE